MIPGEKRAVPAVNISCTQASTYSGDSIQHISIAGRDKWKNSSSLDKSGTLDLHGLTRAQRRVEVVRHKLEFFLHSSYLEGTYGYQGCLIQWPFFQVGHPSCLSVSHLLLFFIFLSLSLSLMHTNTHPPTTIYPSVYREWLPTPVFSPGLFHGQKSLAGYNPWGHRVGHHWANNTFTFQITKSWMC